MNSTGVTQKLMILVRNCLHKRAFCGLHSPASSKVHKQSNSTKFDYEERISVTLGRNETYKLHPMWLRHHCRCEKCINYQTHQRNIIPAKLPALSVISDISITNDKSLNIKWSDSHESYYDLSWLRENKSSIVKKYRNGLELMPRHDYGMSKYLEKSVDPLDCAVDHQDFMSDDNKGVAKLLDIIVHHGYGIVKNSPPDFGVTKNVVKKISHPQMTMYGDISEWTNNLAHADTAYTSEYVYLHTDTSYFNEPMGLQMFHCLRHEGSGGINSLVDGFRIAKSIFEENENYYRVLSQFLVPFHYIDPTKHYFLSYDTIFTHNCLTGEIERIRYNPHDIAVLNTIPEEQLGKFYEALVHLSERIEENPAWIKLQPGLIIFLDNWRTLHGRTEFTGFRHMCGAYIGRSDWMSKARVLQLVK